MASRKARYECSLNSDLMERAYLELREKAEWRMRDIQALRDLVLVHPGKGIQFNVYPTNYS
jgi:hypothetical protein